MLSLTWTVKEGWHAFYLSVMLTFCEAGFTPTLLTLF